MSRYEVFQSLSKALIAKVQSYKELREKSCDPVSQVLLFKVLQSGCFYKKKHDNSASIREVKLGKKIVHSSIMYVYNNSVAD